MSLSLEFENINIIQEIEAPILFQNLMGPIGPTLTSADPTSASRHFGLTD